MTARVCLFVCLLIVSASAQTVSEMTLEQVLDALDVQPTPTKAAEIAEHGIALARQAKRLPTEALLHAMLGNVLRERGDHQRARIAYDLATEHGAASGNHLAVVIAHNGCGALHGMRQEFDEAKERFRAALAVAREHEQLSGQFRALNGLGLVHQFVGEFEAAIESYAQAVEVCRKTGARRSMAGILNNIGSLYLETREPRRAVELFDESAEIKEELGDRTLHWTQSNLGLALIRLGEFDDAVEYLEEAAASALAQDDVAGALGADVQRAVALFCLGDGDEALSLAERCVSGLETLAPSQDLITAHAVIGSVLRAQGHDDDAMAAFERSRSLIEFVGVDDRGPEALRAIAATYATLGNHDVAYDFATRHAEALRIALTDRGNQAFARFRAEFEAEKSERQIRELERGKEIAALKLESEMRAHQAVAERLRGARRSRNFILAAGVLSILATFLVARLYFSRKRALVEVENLRGLLPLCSSCGHIRDEGGEWQRMEKYIEARTEAHFSHGICPGCTARLYGREFAEEVSREIEESAN